MAFATYPALAIRQPDLGQTLITAAYLKSSKLKNQLMAAKIRRLKLVQGLGAQVMGVNVYGLMVCTAGPRSYLGFRRRYSPGSRGP